MTASTEPLHGFHPGLTIGQVASRLKISPSTARRWVRSGRLPSTQVRSGDGFEYRVPLEALEGLEGSTNPSANPSTNGSTEASIPPSMEASVERSVAMATYNAQLLAPLVAVIERQAEQLISQAETIGRQGAELERAASTIVALGSEVETLRGSHSPVAGQQAASPPDPTRESPLARLYVLTPWVVAVLAIGAVIVLLVVPR